jgi:hypothetical protein
MAALLCVLSQGCGLGLKPYIEPPAEQPHAFVKVRMVHNAQPGPMHTATVLLNGLAVTYPVEPSTAATRALRVRPEGANWHFRSEFYHLVTRTETYTSSESYQCGSTSGPNGMSTPTYCTRQVQHTRTVTDHVTDALCAATVSHAPSVGTTYLVQFDFTGTNQCVAACFEQKEGEDGELKREPCVGSRAAMDR